MFAAAIDEFEHLDDDEIAVALRELEIQRRSLEARFAATVNIASRRGVHLRDNHRSIHGWMKALTNCSNAEASHFMQLGKLLYDISECGEEMNAGRLGIAHATELVRARRNPRCGDQLGDVIPGNHSGSLIRL
jgi:Domain of unknown function (DUF222)